MNKESRNKASRKYDDAHTQRLYIKLNKGTDADILTFMETVGNKQALIKELIRDEIKKRAEK